MNNYNEMLSLKIKDPVDNIWHITFEGPKDSLYQGKYFTL